MARKWLTQEKRSNDELFDALVRNALEFVSTSIGHLQHKPKNAIVDLYTAVELFLKARLMKEHWTLVLSSPESGDLQRLAEGDFLSVNLDAALKRIKSIIGEKIGDNASDNFRALGEHRNQIVHFSHSGMDNPGKTQARVIVEAWASWHYLHALLTETWKAIFKPYATELHVLNQRMMSQGEFIKARFDILKSQIEIQERRGNTITECGHCHMPAAIAGETHSWGTDYACMVCGVDDTAPVECNAELPCPSCNTPFRFFHGEVHACPSCGHKIDTDILIDLCTEHFAEGDAWCDEDQINIASCHKCEYPRPSVFVIEGMWSCVSCFDRGWAAVTCERCSEFVTGDMERIQYFACHKCEPQVREDFRRMTESAQAAASTEGSEAPAAQANS
ncbi:MULTISPECIES: hypothetical protein [unclassified Pseudomonas]|uniref:hypothetical protein n=1 Tax=unclassified Pseudomonas TaxID=196821 RepID=UPI001AECD2A0|nr:hypothetical protein [Pseudomonas sp. PNP]MBP2842166.1 hypothetical protein [Pseudomonas sp. PNP]